jgi:hypothetical protein
MNIVRKAGGKALVVYVGLIVALIVPVGSFAQRVSDGHAASLSSPSASDGTRIVNDTAVPVIVELFTSEGCSSCPPADALLARLENEQSVPGAEVLALEEHVDYWNDLGWADPFSSKQMTLRQEEYAAAFKHGSSYTPQMVVDGQFEFVGSRSDEAKQTIATAATHARAAVSVIRGPGNLVGGGDWVVSVGRLAPGSQDTAEVWLAVTETRLRSNVEAGENAGRDLLHAAVVRQLTKLGVADGRKEEAFAGTAKINLRSGWKKENLRVVVFVQEKNSRHILGAGSLKVVD